MSLSPPQREPCRVSGADRSVTWGHARIVRTIQIHEGTNQVQRMVIARSILGPESRWSNQGICPNVGFEPLTGVRPSRSVDCTNKFLAQAHHPASTY